MKKTIYIFLLLAFFGTAKSQIKIDAFGGYLGVGSIKGNSASVSSFTTTVFADTKLFFSEDLTFRFSFFYARKFDALLPAGTTERYFPFHRGLSVKLIIEQPLSDYFFLEEGIGTLFLNDRTFSDTDQWGIGAAFHLSVGVDFRNYKRPGFKLSVGSDIGTTFTTTTPSYFSAHIQAAYYF